MSDIIETAVLSDNALLREGITKLLDGARFHVSQRTTSLDLHRYDNGQQAPDLFIVVIDDMSCSIVGDIKRQGVWNLRSVGRYLPCWELDAAALDVETPDAETGCSYRKSRTRV